MAQLLETATDRHRAGDLATARRLYQQLLAAQPDHPLALFRCGLLELQEANPERARALIAGAIAVAPSSRGFDLGLGQALQALGRFDEAAAAFRRALADAPDSADAHFALGLALQSRGAHPEAIDAYEQAVRLEPAHFAALNNLGNCRQRCGQFDGAARAYTQALSLRPQAAGVMANLGTALQELERLDEAVEWLHRAAGLEPRVGAHAVNLGIALCRKRDFGAAAQVLEAALAAEPANADAAFNLGIALNALGRARDAADRYREACRLRPGHTDALVNLGNLQRDFGEFAAAAATYAAALATAPDSVPALNNAAVLERSAGHLDAAEDLLRRALRRAPENGVLHDNLGSVLKDAGELDAAVACLRRAVELEPGNSVTHSNLVYALSFQSARPEPILAEALRFGRRFGGRLSGAPPAQPRLRQSPQRLRIGYVSADFREHCQSLFTLPLFTHHDRSAVEVVCYSSVERPDAVTARIAALADVWREVGALDDDALAAQVQADQIDILVDLTMHMARGRPQMFARKPAPIQVAWLAYPGTTGLDAMDYRLTDPRLDPPGSDGDYSERSIRLPDSFWCYDPLAAEPLVGPLPALRRGHVTFGCLNNPCKLTDDTLSLWGKVWGEVPDARLTLLAPPGRHRERLSGRLAAHGIGVDRVDFTGHLRRDHYLRAYHGIDISLDTTPYNGHTTSLDSLWMGVPTVTRVGRTCVGRGGLSQLHQVGLPELAADSDAAFVAAAAALARDLPRLARLRMDLRPRLEASPLMDAPRFARNLEAAYRGMWHATCDAGERAADAIMRFGTR